MRRTLTTRVIPAALAGALVLTALPSVAHADTLERAGSGGVLQSVAINTLYVIVASLFVFFMQAGFMFLEIGFSRGKNAGTIVAKILVNFSICALVWWACGFAFAFGATPDWAGGTDGLGGVIGWEGFFLRNFGDPATAFPVMAFSSVTVDAKFFFQFVFAAVSLAIVWGSTLERIKFGVYVMYAVVFSAIIYPIGAHWVFGGGWLQSGQTFLMPTGIQDFAGSTAVHLIGATGALAALLHLGPRKGKYGSDGQPRAIPGHSMPWFGLSVVILWVGWFGFNPGSTLGGLDGRFAEVMIVTNLAAACGVLGAVLTARLKTGWIDIGMAGNGAIGALVAITAPSGYVEPWAAPIIGFIAGVIVPLGVYAIDKHLDDPVGVLTAHGICGVWGTLACGFFTSPRLAQYNAFGDPEGGLFYSGKFTQLIAQAVGLTIAFTFVFVVSWLTFWVIKNTYGMRVSEEDEDAGLDISEHGMYGYPEQFIPAPELIGYSPAVAGFSSSSASTTKEVPAT